MGWDDPRMPTICALRRKGYTPASVRNFAEMVGVAKRDNVIDLGKLEYCVREDLNRVAQRRMAVLNPLKVVITNYEDDKTELFTCPPVSCADASARNGSPCCWRCAGGTGRWSVSTRPCPCSAPARWNGSTSSGAAAGMPCRTKTAACRSCRMPARTNRPLPVMLSLWTT